MIGCRVCRDLKCTVKSALVGVGLKDMFAKSSKCVLKSLIFKMLRVLKYILLELATGKTYSDQQLILIGHALEAQLTARALFYFGEQGTMSCARALFK